MIYNKTIFAFIFLFLFSICSSSDDVNNQKDLTFLLHENLVNKLLLNFGSIESEGKTGIIRYRIKISNFSFNFINGKGKLKFDVRVSGKKNKIAITKKVISDLTIKYDKKSNSIVLDIKEVKIDFGKLLGKIKVTKFLKEKQFTMPGPDLSSFSISKDNKMIAPSIKDAEALFIKDAIKIGFTFDFK